jgi:hypothetical protein
VGQLAPLEAETRGALRPLTLRLRETRKAAAGHTATRTRLLRERKPTGAGGAGSALAVLESVFTTQWAPCRRFLAAQGVLSVRKTRTVLRDGLCSCPWSGATPAVADSVGRVRWLFLDLALLFPSCACVRRPLPSDAGPA